ncbi:MAG: Do family serine endopeptidase [Alkalispirochaetaceae bacterium]
MKTRKRITNLRHGIIAGLLIIAAAGSASAQASSRAIDMVEAHQQVIREASRRVLPVVVEVITVENVTQEFRSPFEFFFGAPPEDGREREREFQRRGLGSGIIMQRDGDNYYVATNNHVVAEADRITINLHDERSYDGELVGRDPDRDLALIRINTDDDLPVAPLGDSDELEVGDLVLAVGNPLGFESTVTSGIVSAVGRQAQPGVAPLTDYIQTDAAINRGNSGGALVNIRGEVVGINTWIASASGGSIGIGFAIPINNARQSIEQLIETGSVQYGWLGVNMGDTPRTSNNSLGERAGGAFVYGVFRDSPADEAGIQPGDIIYRINNTTISDGQDLLRTVANLPPGQTANFLIRRYNSARRIQVDLGTRAAEQEENNTPSNLWPGMSVVEITDQVRNRLDISPRSGELIISQVVRGSPAATAGLRSGDIIQQVNGRSIDNLREFYRSLNETERDEVVFRILRGENSVIIGLVKE